MASPTPGNQSPPARRAALVVLLAIVALGAAVRLVNLTARTMTHIEMYVPGIDLPEGISTPAPRRTAFDVMVGLLGEGEPHPPGHYYLMMPWTRLVGASPWALRLPSAVFGVLAIPVLYWLGLREGDQRSGLLAAALLAFHGYHIFWSQLSKMYVLSCLLGLLSTTLLLVATAEQDRRRRAWWQVLYAAATLATLGTTHFAWFLVAAQVLWTLLRTTPAGSMPGALRVQTAVITLGTPLASLALFQSRRPSYLENPLGNAGLFYQFGVLFEPDGNSGPYSTAFVIGGVVLAIAGLALLVLGLRSGGSCGQCADDGNEDRWWSAAVVAAVPPALAVNYLFYRVCSWSRDTEYVRLVAASAALPVLIAAIHLVLLRGWPWFARRVTRVCQAARLPRDAELSAHLSVVPVALMLLLSPAVNMLAPRGLLMFVPYVLLVVARGLLALAGRSRAWVAFALLLLVAYPLSIYYYATGHHEHPTDYAGLANKLSGQIRPDDLIFAQHHWGTTPMFYYLTPDRYHLVGKDFEAALRAHPASRVWVIRCHELDIPAEMSSALAGRRPTRKVEARWISAELYE